MKKPFMFAIVVGAGLSLGFSIAAYLAGDSVAGALLGSRWFCDVDVVINGETVFTGNAAQVSIKNESFQGVMVQIHPLNGEKIKIYYANDVVIRPVE